MQGRLFLVGLLLISRASALTLRPSNLVNLNLSSVWTSHSELIQRARSLSADREEPAAVCVSWRRLWRELRTTQQLSYVGPASACSLLLTASGLLEPRLRGQLFDAVLQPGATAAILWPRLRVLALLAFFGWALQIASATLFAAARWSSELSARVRLMRSVLAQEPAFFDAQPSAELAARLISEPERLQEVANRGPEKALNALLSAGGGMLLMLRTEWRLALLAVLLRAPLLGALATTAGKTVGLYSALQQHALNEANALAAEVLGQSRSVVASDAATSVLDEYAQRVRGYAEVQLSLTRPLGDPPTRKPSH